VADVVAIAERCIVQVVTIAKFRRPANPRRCSIKLYHVWRWRGGPVPPPDLPCQCGAIRVERPQ
jgi:hypothetical protein